MDGGPWGRDQTGNGQPAGNWNHAASGAYVGQQNGVNYGQTTFHNYGDTYTVDRDDPPERKFVALLAGSAGAPATAAAVPLLAAGAALAARCEITRTRQRLRRARQDREHGIPYAPQPPVSPGHWVRTAFVLDVHQRVDAAFRAARPHIAGDWDAASRGPREQLKARLVRLYGNVRVQPAPAGLDWLIRWHADRVAARWRNGTLYAYQAAAGPRPGLVTAGVRAGIGLAAAGLLVLAAGGGFVAALLIGVGGYHAGRHGTLHLAARRDAADGHAENEQLFAAEHRAYRDWCEMLSDRHTDQEMATWLDLDTSYLKSCALNQARLTNRDIIAHVVMTTKGAAAMRARAVPGPPRYSAYVVLVFLLTHNGVREVEVDLDFLTGAVSDERRTSFRYDALASARVVETGVRTAPAGSAETTEIVAVRSLEFRLTLVNRESIKVTVENFSDPDQPEDQAQLMSNTLQSSGVASALHVLEAVAAEGADWISREQERRRRASYDWYGIDDQDPLART